MEIQYKLIVIYSVFLTYMLTFCTVLCAQNLVVISKFKTYSQEVKVDSMKKMVELRAIIPGLIYDLRYATKNNFTKTKLYKNGNRTFARLPVGVVLKRIQLSLNELGYGIKIFDAYRPYSVSVKMWTLIHDERYVADPAKGSGHNRGLALDLTLVDMRTGMELDMGTGFDNFTDSAHHTFKNLPEDVLKHRLLLREIMENNGFKALETEWWHYNWPNDRNYEVLDLDFKKL